MLSTTPDPEGLSVLNTVFGVPTHPLIVHAVVVLVPLAALGAIVMVVAPKLRDHYGYLVAACAALDVVLVPLATGSGESLESSLVSARGGVEDPLLAKHVHMGEQLLPFVIVMAVGAVVAVVIHHFAIRRAQDAPRPSWSAPWITQVALVLALVGSVGALVQTARIGHSGAKAAWSEVARG